MKTETAVSINIDKIDKNAVCQRLGYKGHSIPTSISSSVDSNIKSAYKLIKPRYAYVPKVIDGTLRQEVFMAGHLVFTSQTISYVLSDCKWAVVFLVTIGGDLEREVSRLMEKGDMLNAFILDTIGSEAAEKAADYLQDAVSETAKAIGYNTTLRYSPGYCDWDLSQQKIIFQIIEPTVLGVNLTESFMMIPRKSVSGVIGIGKFSKSKLPPCLRFNRKKSCQYKRTKL